MFYPKRDAATRVVPAYDARHVAEPGKGYDTKAAEWRARLSKGESDDSE